MAVGNLGGIAGFWINGVSYSVGGTASYESGGYTRNPVMNAQGVLVGWTETPRPAALKMEIVDAASLSIAVLNALSDATVVVEGKIGRTVTLIGAFRSGDPITQDMLMGKFPLDMTGSDLEVQ